MGGQPGSAAEMAAELTIEEIDDAGLARTWPVMGQLRPHLDLAAYQAMVHGMRLSDGFRVIAAVRDGTVVGLAGLGQGGSDPTGVRGGAPGLRNAADRCAPLL